MKRKVITFLIAFIIWGILFGFLMYHTELNKDFYAAIKAGSFFGFFMGVAEVFINPWFKNYFSNKKK